MQYSILLRLVRYCITSTRATHSHPGTIGAANRLYHYQSKSPKALTILLATLLCFGSGTSVKAGTVVLTNPLVSYSLSTNNEIQSTLDAIESICHVNFRVIDTPWARTHFSLKHQLSDGAISVLEREGSQKSIFPMQHGVPDVSKSLHYNPLRLYTLKDLSLQGNTPNELSGTAGVERDDVSGKIAQSLGLEFYESNSPESLVRMLLRRRLEYILVSEYQVASYLRELDTNNEITAVSSVYIPVPFYITFSEVFYRENRTTAQCIWEGVGTERKSNYAHQRS